MSDRPYHHGNLRAELLQRARDAVELEGVASLSLRGIARAAGVSHGASARHFADKGALLDALAIDGFLSLDAAVAEAAAAPGSYEERMRAIASAYVGFAVAHPGLLAVMYEAKHAADASDDLRDASHAGKAALVRFIVEAQDAGAVRAGDPEEIALIAFASAHGVATLATADLLDMPTDAALDRVVDFLWRGVATAPVP
jgi:AcrR family transcriptional regulator